MTANRRALRIDLSGEQGAADDSGASVVDVADSVEVADFVVLLVDVFRSAMGPMLAEYAMVRGIWDCS